MVSVLAVSVVVFVVTRWFDGNERLEQTLREKDCEITSDWWMRMNTQGLKQDEETRVF